jgi:hypothetical protein
VGGNGSWILIPFRQRKSENEFNTILDKTEWKVKANNRFMLTFLLGCYLFSGDFSLNIAYRSVNRNKSEESSLLDQHIKTRENSIKQN